MRIVIVDYLGHAPQVQLSRALASRGHDVLHLYSADLQRPKADLTKKPSDPTSLVIEGLALHAKPSESFLRQRLQESAFGRALARRALAFRPDIIMGSNNPLDAQRHLEAVSLRDGIRFVYWMQEFCAVKIDQVLQSRSALVNALVGAYYHEMERRLLYKSDAIIAITPDQLGVLSESWGISDRQCMVVQTWAPLDPFIPSDSGKHWLEDHGLLGKKIVLYTGALGPQEDATMLLQVASRLQHRPDIHFIIISEGHGARQVALQAQAQDLQNLLVLPFQPYEIANDVLASADVLVATVDAAASILDAPTKIATYLSVGRPIILSAPRHNLAAAAVRDSQGGDLVAPGDVAAMATAIVRFLDDPQLAKEAGARARRYAENTFDISKIADRFERLFDRLLTGTPRRRIPRTGAAVNPSL